MAVVLKPRQPFFPLVRVYNGEMEAPALSAHINDAINYLRAVLQHKIDCANDLSSLKYNMIVMEILDAAKKISGYGKRVML